MFRYLREILAARSVEAAWDLHLERMAGFGFDRVIYGFTRFRTRNDFGRLEDMLLLSNHSPEFIKGFITERRFERGPITRWSSTNSGSVTWDWIGKEADEGRLSAQEQEVVGFCIAHGVRAGVTISFPEESPRVTGAVALCAHKDLRQKDVNELWAKHGDEIYVLNAIFHLRLSSLPYATSARPLTNRQREVLEWIADGKTSSVVADILGLTPATVEKHLRLAREALDVQTTAQAIAKAVAQKQLFIGSGS